MTAEKDVSINYGNEWRRLFPVIYAARSRVLTMIMSSSKKPLKLSLSIF